MVAEGHPVGQQIRSGLPESPPKTPASYHRYAAFAGNTTNSRSTDLSARTASTGLIGGSAAASPSVSFRSPIVAMAHLQDQSPSNLQAKFLKKTLFCTLTRRGRRRRVGIDKRPGLDSFEPRSGQFLSIYKVLLILKQLELKKDSFIR